MKKLYLTLLLVLIASLGFVFKDEIATASSPYFVRLGGTSTTATTSATYLAGGLATSSATIADVYKMNGTGELSGDMNMRLKVQFNASSSVSNLQWKYEYSDGNNCDVFPLQCDWYAEGFYTNANATSTYLGGTERVYNWVYAASSTMGSEIAPRATSTKILLVPILSRYTRVVFFMPPGGARGSFWAEIMGAQPRF